MTDNRNWRNQSQQSNHDWEQQRNRYNQENEHRRNENSGNYSNTGYSSQNRDDYNNEGYGSYNNDYENRVRYGNQQSDWRDNRYSQYNREQDYNSSNAWNRNQGYAGNTGNYGSQDWRRGNEYGSQYGMGNHGSSSNYGTDYRQGSQDRYRTSSGYYGNRGYADQNYNAGRHEHDRDWWDRTRDEVSSWFGDEDADRRRRMDKIQAGKYKGKGPKDYRRSEDRIREDVCDRLTDDDMLDASNIQIHVQGDEVILTGSVDSREQKRRAEDIVDSISGVKNVENRIRVDHSHEAILSSNTEKVRLSKDNK